MASEILGLFASPQQYQQQQQDLARARAIEYARLDPFQKAESAIGQGAYGLAGAIAGALGGVDPQLQKITQRQQMLGMIDPANPDSYAQAIQAALQVGDQEAAFLLRNEMMKVKEQAQNQQLNELKTQDYLTQRGQGMQAAGLSNMANELVGQLKNPDGTINEEVKAKLLSFPQGRAAISEQAKILPDLRQLGASGVPETNPFDLFINDPTVPAALKTTAKQYQSSFAKGIYSPEQADKLVANLSTAAQRSAEFQQTQSRLDQNQQMLNSFKQQGLANSQASLNLQRQQAELNNDFKRQKLERDAEANLAKVEAGKTELEDQLATLRNAFTTLNEKRAIPSTERNVASNVLSYIQGSGVGQVAGRMGGTKEQVERDVINSSKQRLVAAIKNATGMSSQQLNSNFELKTMLDSLSDVNLGYEASMRIIDNLENTYVKGTGMGKSGMSTEDKQALQWANSNPNDPRSAQIKQRLGVR